MLAPSNQLETRDLTGPTVYISGVLSIFEGLGELLTALRRSVNLSQEEAAQRAGLSYRTVGHYEHERIQPSLAALGRLLLVYGIQTPREFAEAFESLRGGTVGEAPMRYDAVDLASRDDEIARLRAELDEANRAVRKAVLGAGMISVGRDEG